VEAHLSERNKVGRDSKGKTRRNYKNYERDPWNLFANTVQASTKCIFRQRESFWKPYALFVWFDKVVLHRFNSMGSGFTLLLLALERYFVFFLHHKTVTQLVQLDRDPPLEKK